MPVYQVGKPYNPAATKWPQGAQYNFRSGQHELFLSWERPSKKEVRSVQSARADFGFLEWEHTVFLLYRFALGPWSDQPFSYHLVPKGERELPPELDGEKGERTLLTVLLVSSEDGILRAIRALTLSPEVSSGLNKAIVRNALADWPGPEAYEFAVKRAYAKYPSADQMAAAALTCVGGS
jgi:hypothetical protein